MIIKKFTKSLKPKNISQDAVQQVKIQEPVKKEEVVEQAPKVDLTEIDNIDFAQRMERRRGDRRRGFRRIDDRNLVSRAQEEAGAIKDASAQEGYKEGIAKAQADIEELRNSLKAFLSAKEDVFGYIAPDIVEISVDIARKIVKKEIDVEPQSALDMVMDVLKNISKDEKHVNIKVNPSQLAFIKENLPESIASAGIEAKIKVSPDDTVDEGGCVVYTTNGVIDATINTQLEIIKEALKGI